jgi:hypothetical protein
MMSIYPRIGVVGVVEGDGWCSQMQRSKRIDHNREFISKLHLATRFDCAGMGTVRDTVGMQCQGPQFDASATAEIASHIKKNFIGFNVAMGVGHFDRLRMSIQHARRKRAHNKSGRFKRLMDGRWLMDGSRDRLEVIRIESIRVDHAIPANDIEGVIGHGIASPLFSIFDPNNKLTFAAIG